MAAYRREGGGGVRILGYDRCTTIRFYTRQYTLWLRTSRKVNGHMGVRVPSGVQGQRMHAFDLTEEVSVTDGGFESHGCQ